MPEITYREVLAAVLILAGLVVFALGRDKLRQGFVLCVATLGLGYRTLALTPVLRVHPAEVLLWALCLYLLLRPRPAPSGTARYRLPRWLWLFMPFWLLGWIPLQDNPYDWDVQFSEFRDFCLLIPTFVVAGAVLATTEGWRAVVLSFFGMSVCVAGLGVLEYVVPGVRDLLPGFVSDPTALVTIEGFARARFSFWGGPNATFLCVLALPLTIPVWRWWPAPGPRAAALAGVGLQLAAVYVGGYRSIWLLTGALALLFALVGKRYLLGLLVLVTVLVGHQALPTETQERLSSLGMVLQGQPTDSSGIDRKERALGALAATLEQPLGNGWAAAGWVHSDFLQVTANLGPLAGLAFLGGYLGTLWRLWLRVRPGLADDGAGLSLGLFLSFVAAGGIMAVEGVQVMPHTILPIWLVWALADRSLCSSRAVLKTSPAAGPHPAGAGPGPATPVLRDAA
jgi:hypothetical protein